MKPPAQKHHSPATAETETEPANDRGSVSVEVAILGSLIVVAFFSLMQFAGQVQQQENGIRAAAHAAARAASLRNELGPAVAAAEATAQANLIERDVSCRNPAVSVRFDPPTPQPGGTVMVTVTCSTGVDSFDVTASHSAEEVIDVYRGE